MFLRTAVTYAVELKTFLTKGKIPLRVSKNYDSPYKPNGKVLEVEGIAGLVTAGGTKFTDAHYELARVAIQRLIPKTASLVQHNFVRYGVTRKPPGVLRVCWRFQTPPIPPRAPLEPCSRFAHPCRGIQDLNSMESCSHGYAMTVPRRPNPSALIRVGTKTKFCRFGSRGHGTTFSCTLPGPFVTFGSLKHNQKAFCASQPDTDPLVRAWHLCGVLHST